MSVLPTIKGRWEENFPLYIKLKRVRAAEMKRLFKQSPHMMYLQGYPTVCYRAGGEWRVWPNIARGVSLVYARGRKMPHSICIEPFGDLPADSIPGA